jgi:hypothetical protein
MKKTIFLGLVALLIGCAGIQEVYKDQYIENDFRYVNDTIGFSITFNNSWRLYPHTASMPRHIKGVAKELSAQGAEMLFFATSSDGLLGARAIVEETDWSLDKYYKIVFEVNRDEFDHISYDIVKTGHMDMIEWIYKTDKFTFQEYQVKNGKYNIRLSFWTFTTLFDDYKDEFYNISKTLQLPITTTSH